MDSKLSLGIILRELSIFKQLGFTLIEIMLVLTIMGVTLGLVAVNFGADERQQLQQEGQRLALLLSYASNSARTTGKTVAWQPSKRGYLFMQRSTKPNNWDIVLQDHHLRQRELPEEMRLGKLTIAGSLALQNEMIIFSPSGLNPAFTITLHSEHSRLNIVGDILGKVSASTALEVL